MRLEVTLTSLALHLQEFVTPSKFSHTLSQAINLNKRLNSRFRPLTFTKLRLWPPKEKNYKIVP